MRLERASRRKRASPPMAKPPFRIPSMAEIEAVRGSTGLTVVSTFSGCGGSCLGFEMAGYRVVWANEFVPAARETYAANHPSVILDGRDIRAVTADEILKAIGLGRGEVDVLNGSPPCAAFSSAGSREQGWGKVKKYSDTTQRSDDLFFEFARLLEGIQPRCFVAENVAGLTIGSAIGYFQSIMRALDGAGYNVSCRVLDAQWLGVPQSRRRAIFVGVRKDLTGAPAHPRPFPFGYSIREAWSSLPIAADDPFDGSLDGMAIGKEWASLRPGEQSRRYLSLIRSDLDSPSPCVTTKAGVRSAAGVTHPNEPRKFTIAELKPICGFPADFVLTGTYAQRCERLGRAVPPLMMREIAATVRDSILKPLGRVRKDFSEAR